MVSGWEGASQGISAEVQREGAGDGDKASFAVITVEVLEGDTARNYRVEWNSCSHELGLQFVCNMLSSFVPPYRPTSRNPNTAVLVVT